MKTKMIWKKLQIAIGILTILVSIDGIAHAMVVDDKGAPSLDGRNLMMRGGKKAQEPQYAEGEVLVKFKEGIDPSSILKDAGIEAKGVERIHSIKPAVANFKKDYKLEKDSKGWYSFLGKQYKEVEEIPYEEMFKEAYANMPETEKALYRSYKVELPEGVSVEEAVEKLKSDPNVEYAEPNRIMKIQMIPNDPYYNTQPDPEGKYSWGQRYPDLWGLKPGKLNCEAAWDISQGDGVVVAVIDTGVDYNHPDLTANIWVNPDEVKDANNDGVIDINDIDTNHNGVLEPEELAAVRDGIDNGYDDPLGTPPEKRGNGYIDDIFGYDFANNDNDPMDGNGHGTHVSGTIAALGNNNIGVVGVAPKAKIMAIKGLSDSGGGQVDELAQCIIYAANNGAKILSNSWGTIGTSMTLIDAFNTAYQLGSLPIAAAGNNNINVSEFTPAGIDTVMAVAASTKNDAKCSFSNYGDKIDVAAPGGGDYNELGTGRLDLYNILSTISNANTYSSLIIGNNYARLAGTSMACPHVSGVAALIWASKRDLTNKEVQTMIELSTNDIGALGKDIAFGYGRINAYNACVVPRANVSIYPPKSSFVKGVVEICGDAFIDSGEFQYYELYYTPQNNPKDVKKITPAKISTAVENGILAKWNTNDKRIFPDGKGIITLKAVMRGREIYRSIPVTIDNYNEPPELKLSNKAVVLGGVLEFNVTAQDPDDPTTPWGRLVYSCDNPPPGANNIDSQTGLFSWQRPISDRKLYDVTFRVTDSEYSASDTISIIAYEETPITPPDYYRYSTACTSIYKNKIAWVGCQADSDIISLFVYDIVTSQQTKIRDFTIEEDIPLYPDIYEDKIVYCIGNYSTENWGIVTYDMATGLEEKIISNLKLTTMPKIYGNKIIYDAGRIIGEDTGEFFITATLYLFDLRTHKAKKICNDGEAGAIYENNIVFTQQTLMSDIYLYNIKKNKKTQITHITNPQLSPDIWGNKIVWEDDRNGQGWPTIQLFMHDLSTKKEKPITEMFISKPQAPSISDTLVAWYDVRRVKNGDIYIYDIDTGEEIPLVTLPGYQVYPKVYNDMVVWEEFNGEPHIYLDKVYFKPKVASIKPSLLVQGKEFKIVGKRFGDTQELESRVLFSNGVEADIVNWANNEIKCVVPINAQSGLLKVVTPVGESNVINVKVKKPKK